MDVDEEHSLTALTHHLSRSRDYVMKSPTLSEAESESQSGVAAGAREDSNDCIPDHPPAFKFALQLVFQILSSVLWHPTRKPSQYTQSTLNPYLTIILTFLATIPRYRSQTQFHFGNLGALYPVGGSSFLFYCCA